MLLVPGLLAAVGASAAPPCASTVPAAPGEPSFGNAGCLIESRRLTLLLVHRLGGKLGLPGGTGREGEGARCTAHRETWEETGLDVDVGELIMQFDNGFLLFACRARQPLDPASAPPLPDWSRNEVAGLVWADLAKVEPADWRFPKQLRVLQDLPKSEAAE